MKKCFIFLACFAFVSSVSGQTPPIGIAGPSSIADHTLARFSVSGADVKTAWLVMPKASQEVINQQLVVTGAPGAYTIIALAVLDGQPVILQQGLTIGTPQPPIPPVPPVPPVPPIPPVPPPPPPPPPNPPPIPETGLRVLFLFETAELTKLPPAQFLALYDQGVRIFLDSVTATGANNSIHEYRFWDKDVVLLNESDIWKKVLARPHPTLPWMVISNGVTGYEGPMPANAADVISLVKNYVK